MQIGSNLYQIASSLSQNLMTQAQNFMSQGFGQGLMNSSKQHQQAAEQIMQQSTLALNGQDSLNDQNGVVVNIRRSPLTGVEDRNQIQSQDFESSVVSLFEAGVTYSANAKIIKAHKSRWDSLFDERA